MVDEHRFPDDWRRLPLSSLGEYVDVCRSAESMLTDKMFRNHAKDLDR
jgi:hypothetical protein